MDALLRVSYAGAAAVASFSEKRRDSAEKDRRVTLCKMQGVSATGK